MHIKSWLVVVAGVLGCAADSRDDGGASSSSGEPGSSSTAEPSSSSGVDPDSGSGESGVPPVELGCTDPQPILQADGVTPSGFVACDDGFRHRAEAVECVVPDAGTCDDCASDCSELPLGRCVEDLGLGTCSCVSSCASDADCGEGRACSCLGNVPQCVPATCTTSADCGDGLCGISGSGGCEPDNTLACLSADAECRSTTCDDSPGGTQCVCYASGGEYSCHDECFSGCG